MGFHLPRKPPVHIRDNRADKAVVVAKEPLPLPLLPNTLAQPGQIGFEVAAQATHAVRDRLVITSLGAQGQDALQQTGEFLGERVRGSGLGSVCRGS